MNPPPTEIKDTFADSSYTDRTYTDATGAYTESDMLTGVSPANTITVNDSGKAQYIVQTPLFSGPPNDVSQITFNYSAPSSNVITLSVAFQGSGGATPPPSIQIQKWWPSTVTSLYSDVTSDAGSVTLPSPCAPAGGITSGEDFHRVITNVDPALGTYDVRTIDSYVDSSGEGPVCVKISDVEQLFYNYLFNTPYFFYVSQGGAPFQTDTIDESYWLTTSAGALTRVRSDATSANQIPGLAASIAAHNAGLNFMRATQRMQRLEAFATSLKAARTLKGVIIK